jgi:hypothetical protein
MPVAGSALPGGQSPLDGLFLVAQLPASAAFDAAPFVCTDVAVIVEVEEPVELAEAMEEEEFCRCAVLRGPEVNILLTSSEFIAPKPLPLEVHPMRVLGWKVRGGATAVIGGGRWEGWMRRAGEFFLHFVSPSLVCLLQVHSDNPNTSFTRNYVRNTDVVPNSTFCMFVMPPDIECSLPGK